MSVPGWLSRLWYSRADEFVIIKIIIHFPIGLVLGIAYYYAGVHRLDLKPEIDIVVGVGVVVSLGVGWAISQQVRTASVLLIPTMFTREGKFWLTTFTYTLLLSGPIENIIVNSEESLRSIACSIKFISAQHAEKAKLLKVPFRIYGRKLGADLSTFDGQLNKLLNRMSLSTFTVDSIQNPSAFDDGSSLDEAEYDYDEQDKVKDNSDADAMERSIANRNRIDKMKNTAETSCIQMFRDAEEKCRRQFEDILEKCNEAAGSYSGLFSDAKKGIHRRLCRQLDKKPSCSQKVAEEEMQKECNSEEAMSPGFAEAFDAQENIIATSGSEETVKFQIKENLYDRKVNQTSREDIAKGVQREFIQKRRTLEFLTLAVKRVLAFSVLLVLRKAWKYNHNYRTDITFDNVYVTSYFKRIDERRHGEGRQRLLPLKSQERKEILIWSSIKLLSQEKKNLLKNVLAWVLRLTIASLVVAVDYVLHEVLMVIKRHSKMEVQQKGHSSLQVYVTGTGAVSDSMRDLVEGLNYTYTSNNTISNEACLPKPSRLPTHLLVNIYVIMASQLILGLFEAYGLRLRRLIAATAYRKREKKRILYLYNDMLKRRKGYLHHARHQIRKTILEHELEAEPAFRLPCFKSAPRCLVCQTKVKESAKCTNMECKKVYCVQCWQDIKELCLVCTEPALLDQQLSSMTIEEKDRK